VTIANPRIPGYREPFIDPRTGGVSRSWYLFLENLITLVDPNVVPSADDLAVEQAFDSDNTSQVSELQKEIDRLGGQESDDIWAATGTVRYVNATAPTGVLTVGGVPYQNSGTVAFAWSGTSGGVPYFSGTTTMASSGALVDSAVVIGGGAGNAPETIAVGTNNQFLAGNTGAAPGFRAVTLASADFVNQGTTTTVLHGNAAGNPSWGAVVLTTDVSGILPASKGGTGVSNNDSSTVTITGAFATTFVFGAATTQTFPTTSATLARTDAGQTFTGTNTFDALISTATIRTAGYTVATLPAGTVGMRAYVTDATLPVYNGALTGGGAVTVPVFYNGAAWVSA
jgi:hypothetical protein